MKIQTLILGSFQVNCYLVLDEQTRQAAVIDPGFEVQQIIRFLDKYRASYIFLTHAHIDHIGAVAELQKKFMATVVMDERELPLLANVGLQAAMYDLRVPEMFSVDHYAQHGESFSFGTIAVQAISTPGHSPGGLSFLCGDSVFTGDALFFDAIGRTDLPGSSQNQLLHSIQENLFSLAGDIKVYPGHGPNTTIDRERRHNPFF